MQFSLAFSRRAIGRRVALAVVSHHHVDNMQQRLLDACFRICRLAAAVTGAKKASGGRDVKSREMGVLGVFLGWYRMRRNVRQLLEVF